MTDKNIFPISEKVYKIPICDNKECEVCRSVEKILNTGLKRYV